MRYFLLYNDLPCVEIENRTPEFNNRELLLSTGVYKYTMLDNFGGMI
jgi:hypothetical protein